MSCHVIYNFGCVFSVWVKTLAERKSTQTIFSSFFYRLTLTRCHSGVERLQTGNGRIVPFSYPYSLVKPPSIVPRPEARLLKGGGGEFSRIHEHNIPWGGYCDKDYPQRENFKQMFANSTVLMLQKWQTPKFGVVQNFQNTGGPKRGGGGRPPPTHEYTKLWKGQPPGL